MTSQQSASILSATNDALNTLPSDIDLKTYQDINCSCEDYLRQQAKLLSFKKHDVVSSEIIKSRARRAVELTEQGRLLHNKITIFAKYRVVLGGDYATKQTWFDEFLSNTQPLVGALQGKNFDSVEAWEKVIDNAYRYAYRKVNSILSSNVGFGMRVRTLTVQDLYERDYLELHHPPVPEIPQYIVYNSFGLQPPIVNNLGTHSLGTLFEPQDGIPCTPDFDRHFVYLPVKDKYAAFVRLGQVKCFPEDKGSVSRGYIRYWWNIISGTNEPIHDCRVVSELTADRSGFEMFQLDRIISNSVKREALAAKKQTVDVVAMRRREQAVEARDLLEDNNIPYWCSVGVWLYRDSVDQLERDVNDLIQRINPTSSVSRVEYTTEDVWFQTWPFEWESFLTKPDHRRQKYLAFQSLPMIPTVKVKQVDKKGVMLVTRELNTPIYLDIANRKNHTAIFGTTGAAKSNLMLEAIAEYLFYDYFAVIFDFPRPDGTSTYTVLAPLLEKLGVQVAYHNVRESVMNILEFPDLRHIKKAKEYQEQWEYVFHNHVELLCAIVIGTTLNAEREGLVKFLLTSCYADFHADETIKLRYQRAVLREGLVPAWA
ncbi:MAG: hypothetical protein HC820_10135 [Hydrococcus sp. RM1_1_31]|nr:hypothetical protein [Hydrococcus sp. RM1_1_31]